MSSTLHIANFPAALGKLRLEFNASLFVRIGNLPPANHRRSKVMFQTEAAHPQ